MKCLCGYEGEGFIVVSNSISLDSLLALRYEFYACPKCGTLKTDVEEDENDA